MDGADIEGLAQKMLVLHEKKLADIDARLRDREEEVPLHYGPPP